MEQKTLDQILKEIAISPEFPEGKMIGEDPGRHLEKFVNEQAEQKAKDLEKFSKIHFSSALFG